MTEAETTELPDRLHTRVMTVDDLPEVWELETALFPVDAWPFEMFAGELALTETRDYWVVEDASRIVAYCGLMCVLPLADVQTIAVIPEYEGRGIGSHLLRTMLERAVESGATDLLLEVRADNPRAQGLYEYFGFESIHRRPRYYRDGVDAVIMRKVLIPSE